MRERTDRLISSTAEELVEQCSYPLVDEVFGSFTLEERDEVINDLCGRFEGLCYDLIEQHVETEHGHVFDESSDSLYFRYDLDNFPGVELDRLVLKDPVQVPAFNGKLIEYQVEVAREIDAEMRLMLRPTGTAKTLHIDAHSSNDGYFGLNYWVDSRQEGDTLDHAVFDPNSLFVDGVVSDPSLQREDEEPPPLSIQVALVFRLIQAIYVLEQLSSTLDKSHISTGADTRERVASAVENILKD